jgi:cation transport ATPase
MPAPLPSDIAHIIQLAIAPVFTLAGIGALLNVMANRLARVVDRWRSLEGELARQDEPTSRLHLAELAVLDRRMVHTNLAIALSTLAALLICIVIILLFTGQLVAIPVAPAVSILFVISMSLLVVALISFYIEVRIASRTLRVTRALLETGKKQ